MRIGDWSSDVCSSDLAGEIARVKPGGTVLEIGAASGFFLEQARAHGLDPAGIELSRACQRIIREELGIPLLSGSLEDGKSVVQGKSVSVREELGGRGNLKQKRYGQDISKHGNQ